MTKVFANYEGLSKRLCQGHVKDVLKMRQKVIKSHKNRQKEDQKIYDEKMIKPEPSVSVKQISLVTPTPSKNLFNFYGRNIA